MVIWINEIIFQPSDICSDKMHHKTEKHPLPQSFVHLINAA